MTARRALQELIDDGLAYTKIGKGTFVSDKPKVKPNGSLRRDEQFPDLVDTFTGEVCHTKLIEQLLNFRVIEIEQTLNEILASYSAEVVAMKLFPKIIRQLEAQWQRGEINLQTQNYALTTLRCQLTAMVNATTLVEKGPKVLLASAPGDQHEIGLLLLTLSLKRRGFEVIYLGPNVPTAEFHQLIEAIQPQLICFSATTTQSASNLARFSHDLYRRTPPSIVDEAKVGQSSLFTFGGVAFYPKSGIGLIRIWVVPRPYARVSSSKN